MALRALGGEVGFLKTYLQGFWFRRLPGPRRVIFATRAAIGLADGFPRTVEVDDGAGGTITETIEDLPASERFFAGGDTSIRGFGLDMVGLTPQTISPSGFPRGGNAVLILNGELRVPVWRQVGAAFFVDGGNVWDRVTNVELSQVRGTYGFGLRYQSPVGPIRFDIGFKMDRKIVGGELEPRPPVRSESYSASSTASRRASTRSRLTSSSGSTAPSTRRHRRRRSSSVVTPAPGCGGGRAPRARPVPGRRPDR